MSHFQIVAHICRIYPQDTEAPPAGVDDMTKLAYLLEPLNEIYVSHNQPGLLH